MGFVSSSCSSNVCVYVGLFWCIVVNMFFNCCFVNLVVWWLEVEKGGDVIGCFLVVFLCFLFFDGFILGNRGGN